MKTGAVIAGLLVAAGVAGGAWFSWDRLTAGGRGRAAARLREPRAPQHRGERARNRRGPAAGRRRGAGRCPVVRHRGEAQRRGRLEDQQGDVIAKIDSRGLEARLAQARAQVDVVAAGGEPRRGRTGPRAERLDERKLVAASEVEDRPARPRRCEGEAGEGPPRRRRGARPTSATPSSGRRSRARWPRCRTQEGETVAASLQHAHLRHHHRGRCAAN